LRQSLCVRIDWWSRNFAGHVIGPFRALIDPGFHKRDLPRIEWTGRGHSETGRRVDQPVIQLAAFGVTGAYHRLGATTHCVCPAVETKAKHLLVWPVALVAALLEDWPNIPSEIDVRRGLRGGTDNRDDSC
jgi:hypothetical protein